MQASCFATRPANLTEAVDTLLDAMDDLDRRHLLETPETIVHHMGLGLTIRNQWVYPERSALVEHFREEYGLGHPDDVSAIILQSLTARLRHADFDVRVEAARLRRSWTEQGVDPLDFSRIDVPGDPVLDEFLNTPIPPRRRSLWKPWTWFSKR